MRRVGGGFSIVWVLAWGLAAGFLVVLVLSSPAAGGPVRAPATATPTPTPIPTRKVGWLNSAPVRAPQGLQRTVTMPGGGGGGGEGACAQVLLAPGAEAWAINRTSILVGAPHGFADLMAWYCGDQPDPNAQFFLTGPAGNTWELPAVGDRTSVEYDFPPTAAEGAYRLAIHTRDRWLEATVTVYLYAGPRLVLWDVKTSTPQQLFLPGQSMYADYSGFVPGTRLEVGLYRTDPKNWDGAALVDLWQITIGPTGRYYEILPIQANTPRTNYALIACDLSVCKPQLNRLANQLATDVFWEEFIVTEYASVSATIGASGLPMWSSLNAGAQTVRTLQVGEDVKILEGPSYVQGWPWYRVEHTASHVQGWVAGAYLTAGSQ